jgi:hypothetical protein
MGLEFPSLYEIVHSSDKILQSKSSLCLELGNHCSTSAFSAELVTDVFPRTVIARGEFVLNHRDDNSLHIPGMRITCAIIYRSLVRSVVGCLTGLAPGTVLLA